MGKLAISLQSYKHLVKISSSPAPAATNNKEITIASLNVRTLKTYEREVELDHALKEIKFDILGLSEVRQVGEAIIEQPNGNLFCYKGTTPGQKGVGFIIKNSMKHMVCEIAGISERIMVLVLNTKHSRITITQVYAPTESSNEQELEDFYEQLENTLEKYKSPINLVIGDFNSKIGWRELGEEETMGPYGLGKRNERGKRLLRFAQEQRLKIANTFFKKNKRERWTWQSPDGKTRNEIDFILTDQINLLKDIQVVKNLKFVTDHRMIRTIFQCSRRRYRAKPSRPAVEKLNKNKFLEKLQVELTQTSINADTGAVESYNALEQSIIQASNHSFTNRASTKPKYTLKQSTIELIKQRDSLNHTRLNSEGARKRFAELDKRTKREIRKDIREHRSTTMR